MARAKRPYAWPHPDEIVKRIVETERPGAKMRWHVIYLICRVDPKRKSPLKDKEIADRVGYKVQHIENVRRAFLERGPDAMDMGFSFARPNAGRKAIFGQDDLERLAAYLQDIGKPGWENVQSFCKDVLKMEKPVSEATARRRFQDYLKKLQSPKEIDEPAVSEEQTTPEKQIVPKEPEKPSTSKVKAASQKPEVVSSLASSPRYPGIFKDLFDDQT